MKRNRGFSLVELMVAMVIGLIIVLGAGQLFLTVFQTNRQVELLSEKQAAVNFAVESILRDVRRARNWDPSDCCDDDEQLVLEVPNRGDMPSCYEDYVEKTYRLSDRVAVVGGENVRFLELETSCLDDNDVLVGSPVLAELVGGFVEGGFSVEALSDYGAIVGLILRMSDGGSESLDFYAINRTAALNTEAPEPE
ncbi:prepilin-type N-terminal cleavage/methylation domain-containing protein [Halomonas sp. ML-15]|uniref:PilW family protein n=1 Tax=Halomonas sp. ML-15 TaxID=2773305 RepID=UPI00174600D3|nr:prepilin-type N-terminal cleavage/methylation domain-containing protein [Halomonas sp. ML-15]MBD3897938.1 prepilin-type N-terminal cleavage/methylation domain-containing protein [Halomonas sp. ML-15]